MPKITQYDLVTALHWADQIVVVQNGVTKRCTIEQIYELMGHTTTSSTTTSSTTTSTSSSTCSTSSSTCSTSSTASTVSTTVSTLSTTTSSSTSTSSSTTTSSYSSTSTSSSTTTSSTMTSTSSTSSTLTTTSSTASTISTTSSSMSTTTTTTLSTTTSSSSSSSTSSTATTDTTTTTTTTTITTTTSSSSSTSTTASTQSTTTTSSSSTSSTSSTQSTTTTSSSSTSSTSSTASTLSTTTSTSTSSTSSSSSTSSTASTLSTTTSTSTSSTSSSSTSSTASTLSTTSSTMSSSSTTTTYWCDYNQTFDAQNDWLWDEGAGGCTHSIISGKLRLDIDTPTGGPITGLYKYTIPSGDMDLILDIVDLVNDDDDYISPVFVFGIHDGGYFGSTNFLRMWINQVTSTTWRSLSESRVNNVYDVNTTSSLSQLPTKIRLVKDGTYYKTYYYTDTWHLQHSRDAGAYIDNATNLLIYYRRDGVVGGYIDIDNMKFHTGCPDGTQNWTSTSTSTSSSSTSTTISTTSSTASTISTTSSTASSSSTSSTASTLSTTSSSTSSSSSTLSTTSSTASTLSTTTSSSTSSTASTFSTTTSSSTSTTASTLSTTSSTASTLSTTSSSSSTSTTASTLSTTTSSTLSTTSSTASTTSSTASTLSTTSSSSSTLSTTSSTYYCEYDEDFADSDLWYITKQHGTETATISDGKFLLDVPDGIDGEITALYKFELPSEDFQFTIDLSDYSLDFATGGPKATLMAMDYDGNVYARITIESISASNPSGSTIGFETRASATPQSSYDSVVSPLPNCRLYISKIDTTLSGYYNIGDGWTLITSRDFGGDADELVNLYLALEDVSSHGGSVKWDRLIFGSLCPDGKEAWTTTSSTTTTMSTTTTTSPPA